LPRPVAAEAPGLSIEALAEGIWRHTTWKLLEDGTPFPSNGLLVMGSRGALMIDTTWPTSEMEPLIEKARALIGGRSLRLVVTHAHDDRMSGIEIARVHGIRSYAYTLTQEDAPGRGLPTADRTWMSAKRRFALGGRTVELFHPGAAHTRDNVVAFVEGTGVFFGGCMLRRSGLGNTADADIGAWAASMDRVTAEYGDRTTIAVPGHGDPGGPELLKRTRDIAAEAAGERR
jgi:glyoxylase-like metal-dependent hydrolase (beta-lactamase superfamily II)